MGGREGATLEFITAAIRTQLQGDPSPCPLGHETKVVFHCILLIFKHSLWFDVNRIYREQRDGTPCTQVKVKVHSSTGIPVPDKLLDNYQINEQHFERKCTNNVKSWNKMMMMVLQSQNPRYSERPTGRYKRAPRWGRRTASRCCWTRRRLTTRSISRPERVSREFTGDQLR